MMRIEELLARRTDLSTFLVHLTKDDAAVGGLTAKQKLISMATSGKIQARSAFGPAVPRLTAAGQPVDSQKCVCFTETPLEHVHILTSEIADRDYHFLPYGIAISKKQGRRKGVNPVWYMDITAGHPWLTKPLDQIIDEAIGKGLYVDHPVSRLTPFIEQMGTGTRADGVRYRKEFWWEREWRHQGDVDLFGKPIILCPREDIAELRQIVRDVPEPGKRLYDPAFIDPRWSLEQIIGRLAGFDLDDLGAF